MDGGAHGACGGRRFHALGELAVGQDRSIERVAQGSPGPLRKALPCGSRSRSKRRRLPSKYSASWSATCATASGASAPEMNIMPRTKPASQQSFNKRYPGPPNHIPQIAGCGLICRGLAC